MKTILGILTLAAVVFAGAYFVSDPFRTKVNSFFESATTWTDTNIAKDPEGYLRWTLAEFDRMEDELRGRQVNLRTQLNSLERRREVDARQAPLVEEKLEELKEAYRLANDTGQWPADLGGLRVNEDELRQLILEADERRARYSENARVYDVAVTRTQNDLTRVDSVLRDLRERRSEVDRQLQQVRLHSTFDGIDSLNDRINALLDTTRAVSSETERTLSLDDLFHADGQAAEARRFDDIMRGDP
ncbi:MAG: hypothetical protein JJU00_16445 [Opitutales bacterium]|nr:hypothetical protein [Opitutales bacterium]